MTTAATAVAKIMIPGGHELTQAMASRNVRESFRHQDLCSAMSNDLKNYQTAAVPPTHPVGHKRFTAMETSPS